MCVVGIAHRVSSRLPLIVAANRDEYFARPSVAADWWDERSDILGGRDLVAGGSWLGIGRSGRFAAVTNIYEPEASAGEELASRGMLVAEFLRGRESAASYVAQLASAERRYGAFRLLVLDGDALCFASNRMRSAVLDPGVHVFTSAPPAAKNIRADKLAVAVESAADRQDTGDYLLDALTGPSARGSVEEGMNSVFVVGETFGTRCATVLTVDSRGRARFVEQRFMPGGKPAGRSAYEFDIDA